MVTLGDVDILVTTDLQPTMSSNVHVQVSMSHSMQHPNHLFQLQYLTCFHDTGEHGVRARTSSLIFDNTLCAHHQGRADVDIFPVCHIALALPLLVTIINLE